MADSVKHGDAAPSPESELVGDTPVASVEERMAVIETTLGDIERELNRTRDRVHALEGLRGLIEVLTAQVAGTQDQIRGLRSDVSGLRRVLVSFAVTIAAGVTVFAATMFVLFK